MLRFIGILVFVCGCGTKVDTGNNGDPDVGKSADASGEENNGESDTFLTYCFGVVAELSEDLAKVCDAVPERFENSHGTILEKLCTKKQFGNLVDPQCNWQGDLSIIDAYTFFDSHTELENKSDIFESLGVYSFHVPSDVDSSIDLMYESFENPDYGDTYEELANVSFSQVAVDRDIGQVNYTVEMSGSSSVIRFDGELMVVPVDERIVVMYDQALDNMTTVKKSRQLMIKIDLGSGKHNNIYFDEKMVFDGGQHDIAMRTIQKTMTDRMISSYNNGLK